VNGSIAAPPSLERARLLDRQGRTGEAESAYLNVLRESPSHLEASWRLAQIAATRGNFRTATHLLGDAITAAPDHPQLPLELAVIHLQADESKEAISVLQRTVERSPAHASAWLMLGDAWDYTGDRGKALKAWYQAVTRAQRAGQWRDVGSTPPQLLDSVMSAIRAVRENKRELFLGAYDDLREQHGATALRRVDRAVTAYLGEWTATPRHPNQRPKFFFFPDLPDAAYHDPNLHPWATRLRDAFVPIRDELVELLREDARFESFIDFKPGMAREQYVSGEGPAPAWDAFFFYRHGERFDANHARCPVTSAVLESIELCRVEEQAPEICFSVLRPGTTIMPHHGVTNTRLVMHLPLIVPDDCALNLVGVGEHAWKPGELVMFDDTYLHEAWNRSASTRVIVLMDCWNPHLTPVERQAVKQLVETISGLHLADRGS
jgi:aspartate beta-hydroxylase